jgi:acyl-[acyl carrier protein]--UDP-N-acetylglucosamine O-acyltransferase
MAIPVVHPTASVSPAAIIGDDVEIGPFSIIYDNVIIGDRVRIQSHCEIGVPTVLGNKSPLRISSDALIRSHSVIYESSEFGSRLITGHHVTIREQTIAGENFQIGSYSDVQGTCQIGNYVRLHSGVFVCQHTKIGNFVWILPHVVFTNDPHPPSNLYAAPEIGDHAVICANAVILPGVKIGQYSMVGAQSCVHNDVAPDTVVAGVPAKFLCETSKIKLRDGSGRPAYPWPEHFTRGYPDSITADWAKKSERSSQ